MTDIARIWPLFVGVAICALAALVLVQGLRRLRDQEQQPAATGTVQRTAPPQSKTAVLGRFIALDALGMLFMLWGVLRWVEIV